MRYAQLVLLPALPMLVGCAAKFETIPVQPLELASTLPYSSIYILNVEPNVAEDVSKEISELEIELVERIRELEVVPRVALGDGSATPRDALLIDISISHIRKVTRWKRLFLREWAGRASLRASVDFIEGNTGTHLGSYQVVGESGCGEFSGGTGDAVEKTAEAIVGIVVENYSLRLPGASALLGALGTN